MIRGHRVALSYDDGILAIYIAHAIQGRLIALAYLCETMILSIYKLQRGPEASPNYLHLPHPTTQYKNQ
jgi:hypothetical protein